MPDSVPDKDQVETFIPAVYSMHYCASPCTLAEVQACLIHTMYFITGDLVVMQGEPNYV